MIYSAQPKIRPFLGIGVAMMLSSLSAFAQSRSEPEGHLSLTVNNGSGSEYKPGEEVTVEATPSEGFIFVQWFQISGDGSLENEHQQTTKFTLGKKDAEIVAALAKVETWFPPGPESGKKGLHLPKPKTGQAHRLEQRVRVTLSRGDASHPPFSNIWELVKVKLKWEKVEDINFFDRKEGGEKLESDHELAPNIFEEKDEGVYEAPLWYESTLTSEQMASKLGTGNSLEVTTTLTLLVDNKDQSPPSTGSLLPIEVTDFEAEDYGTGIQTSGTYGDVHLKPGDVVVWGRSLVSAIVKVPNGFSNRIIEPRFVQDVTPNRTRIFTTPTSQGHTKEIMQYQNQKVLDNVLDESWVDLITIRRLGQDVLIESRDQPGQGGGPQHSAILISDKFETYLQYNVLGQGWSTYGKAEWRFSANLIRSGSTWTGSAAITGGTGRLTTEEPVMQPNIHPVQWVPQ